MNLVILSDNEKFFWSLRINDHEICRSGHFNKFFEAVRQAEAFRMGAQIPNILICDNNHSISELNVESEEKTVFSVSPVNGGWHIVIRNPADIVFTDNTVYSSAKSASSYISNLANDIYELADIIDSSGLHLHPLQHSARYRDCFEIIDDHPSRQ
ncbi:MULTISPECIES: hypothetical protein [Klebsiella]|nr:MULTISPECIES: hypothetical protein [Klebsiella]HDG8093295.1 hypothetical protein [Klebsiella oxytoca]MBD0902422.1 hypothetical protein [Klebsiella grimontii]MBR8614893.1 hypothetical protein [Klebsiella pneumoniae subsp. pneumoniae]MCB3565913.1 hypothetical protein [Klebsiella michiganensis]MCD6620358.1 hypothetical protein [Klebsiella michiganensis]